MNEDEIAKNILLDKTCDNCGYRLPLKDCCDQPFDPSPDNLKELPSERTCAFWVSETDEDDWDLIK